MRFVKRIFSRQCGLFCRNVSSYTQGQSPEARIREYFYYIDHQGQLFLDDTKVKNFVTCFKGISISALYTLRPALLSFLLQPSESEPERPLSAGLPVCLALRTRAQLPALRGSAHSFHSPVLRGGA
ncbi:UPF0598 protein C8orf82 homolog isoform 2 [Danio rerio]|uniref:Si:ch1073-287p18.1 n=1 Tax=Danio rerio TaxID=7955 RepID=B8JMG5_DANRE|nr:UPF0598 protein C8orf82 homolog [Danio rerio]|eukprot:NP_001138259.1 UPF0598 protein C8orf82 homolog [Danio rerio]